MRWAKRLWPKRGLWRFVGLLLAAEVFGWVILSAWDGWRPRYEATVRFQISVPIFWGLPTGTPPGATKNAWIFQRGLLGPQPNSRAIVSAVNQAARERATNHRLVPAPPASGYLSMKYLKWKVRNLFNRLSETDNYELIVIANDPETAAQQAESALRAANVTINESEAQAQILKRKAELDELTEKVKYARESGESRLVNLLEAELRGIKTAFHERGLEIELLSWSRPDLRPQPVRTFVRARAQTCILGAAGLVALALFWRERQHVPR